jgi:biotin synthase
MDHLPADSAFLPDRPRHDWTLAEIEALFALPFNELLYRAASVHRRHFDANRIQISRLLSIKTGGCSEDCHYCPQSAHHDTGVEGQPLMELDDVLAAARQAKADGATRFCMGAAWRRPGRDFARVRAMVEAVKELGLETCATLGMLSAEQASDLKDSGLDYYNHNIDTSPDYYQKIITTRTFDDRLDTLGHVRAAGLKVCSGGIVGMGESEGDRARMLLTLATLAEHPESVPINLLIRVPGTPLADLPDSDPFDLVRTVAVARILMPCSHVRLSAGRESMNEAVQALCFFAGAYSLFSGDKLLTAGNAAPDADRALFERLGLVAEEGHVAQEAR